MCHYAGTCTPIAPKKHCETFSREFTKSFNWSWTCQLPRTAELGSRVLWTSANTQTRFWPGNEAHADCLVMWILNGAQTATDVGNPGTAAG